MPIIRSPLPGRTLATLESNFHGLIRQDLGERVDREHLYLPVLEVLTELDSQALWFGIKNHRFANAVSIIRLELDAK